MLGQKDLEEDDSLELCCAKMIGFICLAFAAAIAAFVGIASLLGLS